MAKKKTVKSRKQQISHSPQFLQRYLYYFGTMEFGVAVITYHR